MKTLLKIKEKLGIKTQEIQSGPIQMHWVYKLTIEQTALIFESGDLSVFGRGCKKKHSQFIKEYNSLFNVSTDRKELNNESVRFKMYLKQQKLKAMHDALSIFDAPNCMKEYKLMFGRDYKSKDDLNSIIKRYSFLNEKLLILMKSDNKKEGLSFVEVIDIIEISRGLAIDRNIRLYEFYKMYKKETEKRRDG